MKRVGIIIAALFCVGILCLGFFMLKTRVGKAGSKELTEVEKIITRDMEGDYPKTPRSVVKYYNQIIVSYYGAQYSDAEFDALTEHARALFDADLLANNPKESYKQQVKAEVADYASRKRSVSATSVCDSRDVQFLTDPNNGDNLAFVTASYFVKEGTSYDRTYQKYVLRKDENGRWKILNYYQIAESAAKGDEDD